MNNTKKLTPFAVLITIIGVLLWPLFSHIDMLYWTCKYAAMATCMFYAGCLIAAYLKDIHSKRFIIPVAIATCVCILQKHVIQLFLSYDQSREYLDTIKEYAIILQVTYLAGFVLLGILVSSLYKTQKIAIISDETNSNISPRVTNKIFWKNALIASVFFFAYMLLEKHYYVLRTSFVSWIYNLAVIPLVIMLICIHKCTISKPVQKIGANMPRPLLFIAGMSPGAILLSTLDINANIWQVLTIVPIFAYTISLVIRIFITFLVIVFDKTRLGNIEWKEIFLGAPYIR